MSDENFRRSRFELKSELEGETEPAHDRDALSLLLARWTVPKVTASLDARILSEYRHAGHIQKRSPESAIVVSLQLNLPTNEFIQLPDGNREVTDMRRCRTCDEEFSLQFSFCPLDGTPLNELMTEEAGSHAVVSDPRFSFEVNNESTLPFVSTGLYHLTIIEDAGLTRRLYGELRLAGKQSQLTWPELRRDPLGFSLRALRAYGAAVRQFFATPNVAVATVVAVLFVMTTALGLVWIDHRNKQQQLVADKRRDDLEYLGEYTDIPNLQEELDKGTAGMNKGDGGGSKPNQERPGGGGGGGRSDALDASQGKLPPASLTIPQVVAPDPNPPPLKNPSLPTVATIDADPLLFPTDNRPVPYGDPKSISSDPSSGQGTGNGIGTGTGGGVGSGEGGGKGSGRGGNTGGGNRNEGGGREGGGGEGGKPRVYRGEEVTVKARILAKPAPDYTEEGRRNQVTGTVVLQMVLSSNGSVTNIRAISGLPFGLTEKAIAAARQIRFTPAMKDGRAVSQYIRVEYNFNIY